MHTPFSDWIARATALTRGGDVRAATAAVQAALNRRTEDRTGARTGAGTQGGPYTRGLEGIDLLLRKVTAPLRDLGSRPIDVVDIESVEVVRTKPSSPDSKGSREPVGSFTEGSFTGPSGHRTYKLYVPAGPRDRPVPLVVMLHGCKQDPDDFAAGTVMNVAAEERGFCVLYPAQSQQANPHRCWNWFKHTNQQRGRGEPALLAGMVEQVIASHPIDRQRVYVAGLSAGGAMAAILGESYPDLFAAVGVHSGLAAGAASDLSSALSAMKSGSSGPPSTRPSLTTRPPTIVFHGSGDTVVHPRNGQQAAGAGDGLSRFEESSVEGAAGRREVTRHVFRRPDGTTNDEHWLVHGAPHAWSGGSPNGSYTDAAGPDATAEMLRFFFEHRLH